MAADNKTTNDDWALVEQISRFLCRWAEGWTGSAREDEWPRHAGAAQEIIKMVQGKCA